MLVENVMSEYDDETYTQIEASFRDIDDDAADDIGELLEQMGLQDIFVENALDKRYPGGVVVRVCGLIPDERLMEFSVDRVGPIISASVSHLGIHQLHIERVRYSTAGPEIEWRHPEDGTTTLPDRD
jgi:uncharacterized protein (DUF111 family)